MCRIEEHVPGIRIELFCLWKIWKQQQQQQNQKRNKQNKNVSIFRKENNDIIDTRFTYSNIYWCKHKT